MLICIVECELAKLKTASEAPELTDRFERQPLIDRFEL